MQRKFQLSLVIFGVITVFALSTFPSCAKKDANTRFLGVYPGVLALAKGDTLLDTLVISAGGSSNSITILEKAQGASANATVNANTITLPNQSVPAKGGLYPLTGSGSLNGKALTLTFTEEISGVFVNSVFTGTKQ